MKTVAMGLGTGVALILGLAACGTYEGLRPEAQSVAATTSRPEGKCTVLGSLTGKGGGASGGYVSNEDLIEYAVNDLRNQAATMGATHVVYSAPSMGGTSGTTTSAMVMGEAMRCEAGQQPSAPATPVTVAKSSGCEYDAQCKGDRVCTNHQCVDPAPTSKPEANSAPVTPPPATATATATDSAARP
jgi:hypothetical protein